MTWWVNKWVGFTQIFPKEKSEFIEVFPVPMDGCVWAPFEHWVEMEMDDGKHGTIYPTEIGRRWHRLLPCTSWMWGVMREDVD